MADKVAQRFALPLLTLTLMGFLSLVASASVHAGTFRCSTVDHSKGIHWLVYEQLSDEMGFPPVELSYCEHPTITKWLARWDVFQVHERSGERWRKYATATCFERVLDFNCRITRQVVVGDSHVVAKLERCDIELSVLSELNDSLKRDYPQHELYEVEFMIVDDGGAWSAEEYGFKVRLTNPPDHERGTTFRFVRGCDADGCLWTNQNREGFFGASSSGARLMRMRRVRNDPLIEYLMP